jgi:hypothetical protein
LDFIKANFWRVISKLARWESSSLWILLALDLMVPAKNKTTIQKIISKAIKKL